MGENEKLEKKLKKFRLDKSRLGDSPDFGHSDQNSEELHMSMINLDQSEFLTVEDQFDLNNIIQETHVNKSVDLSEYQKIATDLEDHKHKLKQNNEILD